MGSTANATFEVIPGEPLDFMRDFDLAALGYEEAEYLVTAPRPLTKSRASGAKMVAGP